MGFVINGVASAVSTASITNYWHRSLYNRVWGDEVDGTDL